MAASAAGAKTAAADIDTSTAAAAAPIIELVRRETFSAAHRLHSKHLSDEANRELYGKCNNPNGHGHNYVIHVTVRGPVDPITGMLMNVTTLKKHMDEAVLLVLDHKHLDLDIPYFRDSGLPSTVENLCVFAFNALDCVLPSGLLWKVRIDETEKNSAVYRRPPPRSLLQRLE